MAPEVKDFCVAKVTAWMSRPKQGRRPCQHVLPVGPLGRCQGETGWRSVEWTGPEVRTGSWRGRARVSLGRAALLS